MLSNPLDMIQSISTSSGKRLKQNLRQIIESCVSSPETCQLFIGEKIIPKIVQIHGREGSDFETKNLCIMVIETLRLVGQQGQQQLDLIFIEQKQKEMQKNQKLLMEKIEIAERKANHAEKRAKRAEQMVLNAETKIEIAENNLKQAFEDKNIVFRRMVAHFSQPLANVEEIRNEQLEKEENDCNFLSTMFEGHQNIQMKQLSVELGLFDTFIQIFQTRDLQFIFNYHSSVFLAIVSNNVIDVKQMMIEQKLQPFQGLLRLLDHEDIDVVINSLTSIYNICVDTIESDLSAFPSYIYNAISEDGGTGKIFQTFKHSIYENIQNMAALILALMHQGRQMVNLQMQEQIIAHLLSLQHDENNQILKAAFKRILGLISNKSNLAEVLKRVDLQKIAQNLKLPFNIQSEQDNQQINYGQQKDCLLLSALLNNRLDDTFRKQIVNSGILEAFQVIFNSQPLDQIQKTYYTTFFNIISPSNEQFKLFLCDNDIYQTLVHLLDCPDNSVVDYSLTAITNILLAGIRNSPSISHHPHYRTLTAFFGIQKIYTIFAQTQSKHCKDQAAICLGWAFRARELTSNMQRPIIHYLTNLLNDDDDWSKNAAQSALNSLAQDSSNRTQIEKYGFSLGRQQGQTYNEE